MRSPVAHNDPVAPLMWVQVDVTRVDTPSSVQLSPPTFDVAYAVTPSCYNNGIHNGTIVSMLVVHSLHLDLICDTHGEVSHTIHALCSLSSYHHNLRVHECCTYEQSGFNVVCQCMVLLCHNIFVLYL